MQFSVGAALPLLVFAFALNAPAVKAAEADDGHNIDTLLPSAHLPAGQLPEELRPALQQLWANNPAVRAARAKLAAAAARVDAAGQSLYNPELSLDSESGLEERREIGVAMAIDWSGKVAARERVAQAEYDSTLAEWQAALQQVAADWLREVVAYQAAQEQTSLGHERVELMTRFAELAGRRLRAGDINQIERDLAELALQDALAQLAELEAEQARAEQSLRALGSDTVALPTLMATLPSTATVQVDDGKLAQHVLLRQANQSAQAATARIRVAERERRPDPVLSLTSGTVEADGLRDNIVGVNVSIPLPIFNSYRAEVTAAQADAEQANALLDEMRRRLRAEAYQATVRYNALLTAWQRWQQSPASRVTARADLLQRMWEAGELSSADYLVQLNQTLDTSARGRQLNAQVWQAWLDWLQTAGEFLGWAGLPENDTPGTASADDRRPAR
ncbi:TolC family protein [Permianibacter sp. IMCC34836]|uniref:TolC family protein n=1 Tax=Permianibacter fluminis TaxID=2738515 RepID=UPI0015537A4A|nr:TolC family protein [Permianibacter fluminis]NQD37930.1 TolC family protein [Permianibacter fluminis]